MVPSRLSAGFSQAGRWERKRPGGRASQHAKPGGEKEHQALGGGQEPRAKAVTKRGHVLVSQLTGVQVKQGRRKAVR